MAPRTPITVTSLVGCYPTLPVTADSLDITEEAADVVNGNSFASTGKEILLVHNSDAVNPYTFTLVSVVDKYKRTGDITTYSLAATEIAAIGPIELAGWRQADGNVYIDGSDVAILFAVLRLA